MSVAGTGEQTTIESVELGEQEHFWIGHDECTGRTLAQGKSCQVAVMFDAPDVDGDFEVTLTFHSDEGEVGSALVQGTSYRAGGLTAEPAEVDFGLYSSGTVLLRNRRDEPILVGQATTSPGFSVLQSRCTRVLRPGSGCLIRLEVAAPRVGLLTGSLEVSSRSAYEVSWGSWIEVGPSSTLVVPLRTSTLVRRLRRPLPRPAPVDYTGVKADLARLAGTVRKLVRGGPARRVRLPAFKPPVAGQMRFVLQRVRRGKRARLVAVNAGIAAGQNHRLGFVLPKRARKLLRSRPTRLRVVVGFDPAGTKRKFSQVRAFVVQPPAKKPRRR